MMKIICSHNNSSLLYDKESDRFTFEGDLDDIAYAIAIDYGIVNNPNKTKLPKNNKLSQVGPNPNIGVSPLFVYNSPRDNKYLYCLSKIRPLFLDLLNEKIRDVSEKLTKIKAFI